MSFRAAALVWVVGLMASAQAGASASRHESDLAGPAPLRARSISNVVVPDRVVSDPSPGVTGALEIQLLREVRGADAGVAGVEFETSQGRFATDLAGNASVRTGCAAGGTFELKARLSNRFFSIQNSSDGRTFELKAQVPCQGRVRWSWEQATDAGQVLGIWQVADAARRKVDRAMGLAFWSRAVPFVFPSDGDYYFFGKVNVTRGDHWDVVGHELGHAIYDIGAIGSSEGGQHKIDECYGATLAFSEGWASFFSAWVGVDLSDSDAKFEYMVPRRAPLRFESIPADVCAGQTNEWRVTGFLWDLIDLSRDGEAMESPFALFWASLTGSRAKSAQAAVRAFIRSGAVREAEVRSIWEQNFLTAFVP
jgi:hypothetical protein